MIERGKMIGTLLGLWIVRVLRLCGWRGSLWLVCMVEKHVCMGGEEERPLRGTGKER